MPKFKVFKCMYLVHKKTPAPKSSPMHFHEHALFCGFFCGPIVPRFLLESRPLKINRLTSGDINTPTGHTTASNGKIKCLSRACSSTENVSGAWLTGSCSDAGISFCLKFRDKLDYLGVTEISCCGVVEVLQSPRFVDKVFVLRCLKDHLTLVQLLHKFGFCTRLGLIFFPKFI